MVWCRRRRLALLRRGAIGLLARWCSLILIVPLAFNFCPEPAASLRSQLVQIILQFLGICREFLSLKLFGGFLPLEVEWEEHYVSRLKP